MSIKKPKLPFDREKKLKSFVIQILRRASYRWPPRSEAKSKARIGYGLYECASCEKSFGPKEINLDHTYPVIPTDVGFTNWDTYIDRLLCTADHFKVLCKSCHSSKTILENSLRKIAKFSAFKERMAKKKTPKVATRRKTKKKA